LILGELRKRVEIESYDSGFLGTTIPSSPAADDEAFEGSYYAHETMFAIAQDM